MRLVRDDDKVAKLPNCASHSRKIELPSLKFASLPLVAEETSSFDHDL